MFQVFHDYVTMISSKNTNHYYNLCIKSCKVSLECSHLTSTKPIVSWRGTLSSSSCTVCELQNLTATFIYWIHKWHFQIEKETDGYLLRQQAEQTNKHDILLVTGIIPPVEHLRCDINNFIINKRIVFPILSSVMSFFFQTHVRLMQVKWKLHF